MWNSSINLTPHRGLDIATAGNARHTRNKGNFQAEQTKQEGLSSNSDVAPLISMEATRDGKRRNKIPPGRAWSHTPIGTHRSAHRLLATGDNTICWRAPEVLREKGTTPQPSRQKKTRSWTSVSRLRRRLRSTINPGSLPKEIVPLPATCLPREAETDTPRTNPVIQAAKTHSYRARST